MKIKILDKRGDVAATDLKYTGEEPKWSDDLSVEEYYAKLTKCLGFYAYYCDAGSLLPFVLKWMFENGYSKSDVSIISGAPAYTLTSTTGKLCRMLQRGMPDLHPDSVEHWKKFETLTIKPQPKAASTIIREEIDNVLHELKQKESAVVHKSPKKVVANPHNRMVKAVENSVLPELEVWLDDLMRTTRDVTPAKMVGCDLAALCQANNVPLAALGPIRSWLDRHGSEFLEAYNKEDEQLVEAYRWLSRPQLKKVCDIFAGMSESLQQYSKIKAGSRKPRVKKPKAASAQVAKLNFARDSKEYNVQSIDPTRIPFAQRLYLFNTKNKQLIVYLAQNSTGFSVKGSTLLNYDSSTSYGIGCRKPADVLANVLSLTDKKLDKYLEGLTTKKKPTNGRINSNMILLKTSETR